MYTRRSHLYHQANTFKRCMITLWLSHWFLEMVFLWVNVGLITKRQLLIDRCIHNSSVTTAVVFPKPVLCAVKSSRMFGVLVTLLFSLSTCRHFTIKQFSWSFLAWSLVFFLSWMSKSSAVLLLSCRTHLQLFKQRKIQQKWGNVIMINKYYTRMSRVFRCQWNRPSSAAAIVQRFRKIKLEECTASENHLVVLDVVQSQGWVWAWLEHVAVVGCRVRAWVRALSFVHLVWSDRTGSVSRWIPDTSVEAGEGGGCWMFVSGLLLASHLLLDCCNKLPLC